MTVEVAKTFMTYLLALVVITGGGILLVVPSQVEQDALLPFLTGAIGTVLGYVFSERTSEAATSRAMQLTGPPINGAHSDDDAAATRADG